MGGDSFVVETTAPAGIPVSTLQVIGAGFGRTGTLSTRTALARLGFGPCDHMVENEAHPERFALWVSVHLGKTPSAHDVVRAETAPVSERNRWPRAFSASASTNAVAVTTRDQSNICGLRLSLATGRPFFKSQSSSPPHHATDQIVV